MASWGNYIIFPHYIVESAGAGREWRTDQVESIGAAIANGRWDAGRWHFSLGGARVLSSEIELWDAFVDAVRGAAKPFLFRMNSDRFTLKRQLIGESTTTNPHTTFQLKKTRAIQGRVFEEKVLFPWHDYPPLTFANGVAALETEYVQIEIGSQLQVLGVDYTLNRETGVVTFSKSFEGKVYASCKYMQLVRGFDLAVLQSEGGDSWEFAENASLIEVKNN